MPGCKKVTSSRSIVNDDSVCDSVKIQLNPATVAIFYKVEDIIICLSDSIFYYGALAKRENRIIVRDWLRDEILPAMTNTNSIESPTLFNQNKTEDTVLPAMTNTHLVEPLTLFDSDKTENAEETKPPQKPPEKLKFRITNCNGELYVAITDICGAIYGNRGCFYDKFSQLHHILVAVKKPRRCEIKFLKISKMIDALMRMNPGSRQERREVVIEILQIILREYAPKQSEEKSVPVNQQEEHCEALDVPIITNPLSDVPIANIQDVKEHITKITINHLPYFSIADIKDVKERAVAIAEIFEVDRKSAFKAAIGLKAEEINRPLDALLKIFE